MPRVVEARMAEDVTQPQQHPEPDQGEAVPAPADAAQAAGEALEAAQSAVDHLGHEVEGSGMVGAGAATLVPGGRPESFPLETFGRSAEEGAAKGIDLLSDVNLNVKIELGRTRMLVEDVLKLSEGAVVELDKLAGDPVDVYVNDRHVARGEVLVLNDNFCVRINEIIAGIEGESPADRART
jgi:flagellar motor switch protein FliN